MLHFMLVLGVLTLLALGWFIGSLFVCVFLTLPIAGFMLFFALMGGPGVGFVFGVGALLLAAIWAPRYIRMGMS